MSGARPTVDPSNTANPFGFKDLAAASEDLQSRVHEFYNQLEELSAVTTTIHALSYAADAAADGGMETDTAAFVYLANQLSAAAGRIKSWHDHLHPLTVVVATGDLGALRSFDHLLDPFRETAPAEGA